MVKEKEIKTEVKRNSGEITLTITIPAKKVKGAFAKIKEEALKEVSAPGFRKGKVPREIAEKRLSEDSLAESLFNHLIPPAYTGALREQEVNPIIPPQLRVLKYQKDADLVFEARTAERPKIKIGNYEAALEKLKGKVIYGPNGKPVEGGERVTAAQVLEKLREIAELELPPILVEQEVQRMFSSLLDQAQTLGLTIEQHLSSQGKTVDQLRKDYQEIAKKNFKDEFILSEIAKVKGIKVDTKEIEEAIKAAPDERARKTFSEERGRLYIEEILRKRKTIEHLLRIAEEGK